MGGLGSRHHAKGSIVEKVSEQEHIVQMGIMKMKVALDDLQYIENSKPVETKPLATVRGMESQLLYTTLQAQRIIMLL